jgi:hypothetical protein
MRIIHKILGLLVGLAWACSDASAQLVSVSADYYDHTRQKTPSGSFTNNAIGGSAYDTSHVQVTWSGADVTLKFFTASDFRSFPTYGQILADVFIDLDGGTDFSLGLALSSHSMGQSSTQAGRLYDNLSFRSSDEFFSGSYGKYWEGPSGESIVSEVRIGGGHLVDSFAFTAGNTGLSASNQKFYYQVVLDGVNTDGDWDEFSFYWGSATCGNDAVFVIADLSSVPEPSTYGLLGSLALAGMVVFRRRRASLRRG